LRKHPLQVCSRAFQRHAVTEPRDAEIVKASCVRVRRIERDRNPKGRRGVRVSETGVDPISWTPYSL
jgi:hypothetical protein